MPAIIASRSDPGVSSDNSTRLYLRDSGTEEIIVEAWAQGFHVGGIILLTLLVLCNYRPNVILHKLILVELVLALGHGFFAFFEESAYGWVLSSTALALYVSYNIHNVIAWLKIKPFLSPRGARIFIVSLILVQPYWVVEAWANFEYFNSLGIKVFKEARYCEPLARDPWWVFTTVKLVLVISKNYEFSLYKLIRTSPRFGIMLLCLVLSIVFLVVDIISTALISKQSGINPFWRFALVFKCASDVIFLDDFKSVLDHIVESVMKEFGSFRHGADQGRPSNPSRGESTQKPADEHRGSSASSDDKAMKPWKRRVSSKVGEWYTNAGARSEHREYVTVSGEEDVKRQSSSSSRRNTANTQSNGPQSRDSRTWTFQQGLRKQTLSESQTSECHNADNPIPMVPLRARTKDGISHST